MARLHLGLPSLQGDLKKYKDRFDLLELRPIDSSIPRLTALRRWRKGVPPGFVFSIVLPRVVGELAPGAVLDEALASALEIAAAVEARCIVLATPASVRPTGVNRRRIAQVLEALPREGVVRCWEPTGIWERDDVVATAKSFGVLPVLDAAREDLAPGSMAYTRLRALGKGASFSVATLARIVGRLRSRREAFVVVDSASQAMRVKQTLQVELAKVPPRSISFASARPAVPSALVAEDEEQ
jgi:uncharacterized protein YecE (DUF72 family)